MEIFTEQGWALLLRWAHIGAGITWIGLLYYFNFVQGPSFAAFEAPARTEATRKLVPRALAWFRYSALATWVAGVLLIIFNISVIGENDYPGVLGSGYGTLILSGMILGTIMFLNVWGVIWPNQKIVIASAEAAATGGSADPRAADSARRALLASRTNVIFSIPMIFFMASASHLFSLGESSTKWLYWVIYTGVVVLLEGNALSGLTGTTKKPLEKVNTTIAAGVGLWAILVIVLEAIQGP